MPVRGVEVGRQISTEPLRTPQGAGARGRVRTEVNERTVTTSARVDGRDVQIITYIKHRAPRWAEVYVESRDVDGLMIFRGYYHDMAQRSPRVCERVHPLVAAHMTVIQDVEASRVLYGETVSHR